MPQPYFHHPEGDAHRQRDRELEQQFELLAMVDRRTKRLELMLIKIMNKLGMEAPPPEH